MMEIKKASVEIDLSYKFWRNSALLSQIQLHPVLFKLPPKNFIKPIFQDADEDLLLGGGGVVSRTTTFEFETEPESESAQPASLPEVSRLTAQADSLIFPNIPDYIPASIISFYFYFPPSHSICKDSFTSKNSIYF